MSRYRKIEVKTWSDEKFRQLSPMPPSGQGLWLFLMTGPHTGPIPGLFRAGRAGMAEELGWDLEAFDEAFQEVFQQGMVKADFKARLVWLPNAIKHNKPESPNVVRSWRADLELLPECELKTEAIAHIREHLESVGSPYAAAFDEVSDGTEKPSSKPSLKPSGKPSSKTTPNQEQEQEQDKEHVGSTPSKPRTQSASRFAEFWQAWPAGPRKQARAECEKKWKARGLDSLADEIVGHVQSLLKTKQFQEFTPAPLTYLNQRRWEDGAPTGDGEQAESSLFRGAL